MQKYQLPKENLIRSRKAWKQFIIVVYVVSIYLTELLGRDAGKYRKQGSFQITLSSLPHQREKEDKGSLKQKSLNNKKSSCIWLLDTVRNYVYDNFRLLLQACTHHNLASDVLLGLTCLSVDRSLRVLCLLLLKSIFRLNKINF